MHPLFPRPVKEFTDDDLLEVQRLDHEELLEFLTSLRNLVKRAVELRPNEETQVVLDLKAELEKHYEEACRLADAQGNNKEAISRLIEVIMNTIRRAAAGDPLAEQELAQEAEARRLHFRLLESPLVADLLHPQTLIEPDELAAVLLTDPQDQVEAALELFDDEQLGLLREETRRLVEEAGEAVGEEERARLSWLEERAVARKESG
ncbi:MAG TPA: hypothetical protein ENJ98_05645 [Thiolapillus brandeum]|uniref:Uncharacterized protein n=1 Tax=Thiolapillus brandeum TaxID=1076588 RepID=A0A7C5MXE4_9GAMM|nr:hypothetical protein [Thiolapillus brandeum]